LAKQKYWAVPGRITAAGDYIVIVVAEVQRFEQKQWYIMTHSKNSTFLEVLDKFCSFGEGTGDDAKYMSIA
jgi:hypothetical protein